MSLSRMIVISLACCAGLFAGCASEPEQAGTAKRERVTDDNYVTGSNIPKRNGDRSQVQKMSREEFERARDASAGSGVVRSN